MHIDNRLPYKHVRAPYYPSQYNDPFDTVSMITASSRGVHYFIPSRHWAEVVSFGTVVQCELTGGEDWTWHHGNGQEAKVQSWPDCKLAAWERGKGTSARGWGEADRKTHRDSEYCWSVSLCVLCLMVLVRVLSHLYGVKQAFHGMAFVSVGLLSQVWHSFNSRIRALIECPLMVRCRHFHLFQGYPKERMNERKKEREKNNSISRGPNSVSDLRIEVVLGVHQYLCRKRTFF